MQIETAELEKAVIAQAVATLVDQYSDPGCDIAEAIRAQAKEIIDAQVQVAIESKIKEVIEQGIEKLVFPRTNAFGEQQKPAQTMREYIAEIVHICFTEYLDGEGKPTKDSWYRKPEHQRVQRVIKAAVENAIREDVTAAAKQIHQNINHYLGEFVKIQLNEAAARLK